MKNVILISAAICMIAANPSIAHAKDKADSGIANFNSGVTSYRDKSYYKAIDSFNKAIASGMFDLIASADYNIANSEYRLGELKEKNQDIKGAKELCDMALKFYKRSMDLNPGDKDAKFNYEFVLNKMKDLNEKFQMKNEEKEKEKKQQDKKDKAQQQKDQRSGGEGGEGKEEKQETGDKKQDTSQESKPQEEEQGKTGQQGEQQQEEAQKAEEEKVESTPQEEPKLEGQQEQSGGAEEKGLEAYQSPQGESSPQEMSAEEAKMLLEGYKGEEATGKAIRMRKKPVSLSEPLKDW